MPDFICIDTIVINKIVQIPMCTVPGSSLFPNTFRAQIESEKVPKTSVKEANASNHKSNHPTKDVKFLMLMESSQPDSRGAALRRRPTWMSVKINGYFFARNFYRISMGGGDMM